MYWSILNPINVLAILLVTGCGIPVEWEWFVELNCTVCKKSGDIVANFDVKVKCTWFRIQNIKWRSWNFKIYNFWELCANSWIIHVLLELERSFWILWLIVNTTLALVFLLGFFLKQKLLCTVWYKLPVANDSFVFLCFLIWYLYYWH